MQLEDNITRGVVLVFLCICAVSDIRKKEIPFGMTAAGMTAAAVYTMCRMRNGAVSVTELIFSLLPGLCFLLLSRCTKEKIGYGDGLMLLIIGAAVGFYQCFFALCIGLFFSACFAVLLLILHKAGKGSRLPFIPFLALGMGVYFIL